MADELKPVDRALIERVAGPLALIEMKAGQAHLEWATVARAQGPGEAVADGWVMVPREPTEAMLEELYLSPSDSGRYSAMIAATPTRGLE